MLRNQCPFLLQYSVKQVVVFRGVAFVEGRGQHDDGLAAACQGASVGRCVDADRPARNDGDPARCQTFGQGFGESDGAQVCASRADDGDAGRVTREGAEQLQRFYLGLWVDVGCIDGAPLRGSPVSAREHSGCRCTCMKTWVHVRLSGITAPKLSMVSPMERTR